MTTYSNDGIFTSNDVKMSSNNAIDFLTNFFISRTRVKLLDWFINHPDNRYYARQLSRILKEDYKSIHSELNNLLASNFLKFEFIARSKFYYLNHNFLLKEEFKSILDKTVGLEGGIDKDLKFIISEPQESYGKPEIDSDLVEKMTDADNNKAKRK